MPTPNNLPAELSSFVGREPQLAELRRLLRRSRLITLTGPGGAGKTRLALRLAADIQSHYPDGVWLVDLAPLADARLLEQTVATACRITQKSKRPLAEAVIDGLGSRRVLLMLDGCEHMVDSCASLASRMLRSCPNLTILVTSREPLGVPGELIWRTPSLSTPRSEDSAYPELVLASEAVRLYVDRARLVRPGFQLDQSATASVAQICARLEGMPLAIELAASLAGLMTQEETLDRLRDRFRLLVGGSRTSLPRHQTLRHAVDWSYGLLSPAEKALLDRLAVFAGGFDLTAAEAVAPEGVVDSHGTLQLVSRLVDKSLVVADPGPKRTRYRLLDTIREYALEKLQEDDEAGVRGLHARHYVTWCTRAASELRTGDQLEWLARIDEEVPNIRLALGWALVEQPDDAVRLAAAMGSYWTMRRQYIEGASWLDHVLKVTTSHLEARALALLARARINWRHEDRTGPKRDAEECVQLCIDLGMKEPLANALNLLGLLKGAEGDYMGAEQFYEQVMDLARELGKPILLAGAYNNIGLSASSRGDNERAGQNLERALELAKASKNRFVQVSIQDSVARVMMRKGALDAARRLYLETIVMAAEFADPVNIAVCLEGLALVALAEGRAERTVKLMAAAVSMRAAVGDEATPDWIDEVAHGLASAREHAGRPAADGAWQHGAAMNLQEAVQFAVEAEPSPIRLNGTPLTGREIQVASLIADGLTNAEIAKKLHMADRTADAHVEHIRNKLGLRARSQIAVWAHERLGSAQISK